MPIQIKGVGKPKGGGGGMDIATKRDAMVDKMTKAMTSAMNAGRLSNQDVEKMLKTIRAKKAGGGKVKKMSADAALSRIFNIARGMVSPAYVAAETTARKANVAKGTKKPIKKAGGGKAKKMMAGGGKTKKMMRGGGKTKKYMARGGKAR